MVIGGHSYGRFANQLYFCLKTYKLRKKTGKDILYNPDRCYEDLVAIGCGNLITKEKEEAVFRKGEFFQEIGKDFDVEDLESFIREYILVSDTFCKIRSGILQRFELDKTVAIHIRNGDYINLGPADWFDRNDFLQKAISALPKGINNCVIYSDDPEMCKRMFSDILSAAFDSIEYRSGSVIQDFCELSSFINRIVMNSTFGYWANFISNVLYGEYEKSISPPFHWLGMEKERRVDNRWTMIECKRKNS